MKHQRWGLYAVALAVLLVGLVWAGVPASTVFIGLVVLACPLMMLFMHRGGGHDGSGHDAVQRPSEPRHHDHETTSRR